LVQLTMAGAAAVTSFGSHPPPQARHTSAAMLPSTPTMPVPNNHSCHHPSPPIHQGCPCSQGGHRRKDLAKTAPPPPSTPVTFDHTRASGTTTTVSPHQFMGARCTRGIGLVICCLTFVLGLHHCSATENTPSKFHHINIAKPLNMPTNLMILTPSIHPKPKHSRPYAHPRGEQIFMQSKQRRTT
jgi:hypothetical protein